MPNLKVSDAIDIISKKFSNFPIKTIVELDKSYIFVLGDKDSMINPVGVNKTTGKIEGFNPFLDSAQEYFDKIDSGVGIIYSRGGD